ncbi:hypothetical protein HS088_TW22G01206 [Tripterygium wilfordii]|uniref:Uncharacterized protein n=1 Tax=Tripterygium wilfordii TaxID=458696 RepID=A0A7J7C064_TRIWF|nr:hypothetical protein HS088_TW22G01206 [Tripterygium wilfordii]
MESSCVLVPDADKIHQSFHPRDLNCTHYSRVYRRFLEEDNYTGYELGTRISFDIPDHTPEICKDCDKPNGNCGIGLRCICHPKECRDKVISIGGSINPFGLQCTSPSLNRVASELKTPDYRRKGLRTSFVVCTKRGKTSLNFPNTSILNFLGCPRYIYTTGLRPNTLAQHVWPLIYYWALLFKTLVVGFWPLMYY